MQASFWHVASLLVIIWVGGTAGLFGLLLIVTVVGNKLDERKMGRVPRCVSRLPDCPESVVRILAQRMRPDRIRQWMDATSARLDGFTRRQGWQMGLCEMILRDAEAECRDWRPRPQVPMEPISRLLLIDLDASLRVDQEQNPEAPPG